MLNNYADSGGGFNSNHGQTARPTETQKQQNLGASWSYNSQLEGIYYGSEHQPMYMGSYEGSAKHASYPQYPSGTLHQPVPTPVVQQCHEACCQHYENRYPINPAPLRYQPSGSLQTRYSDIPNSDSRQYFPERRPVQVNLPRKKVYPSENGYAGITDRHYPQYMGRGQALPVDTRQQMQVMRPQYPVNPYYWGSSRGWAGARMNCPPPSYHQSVAQSAQLQQGNKMTDSAQYIDPALQKSLGVQHQRGVGSGGGKLDIIRPVPEQKRPTLDSGLQSCYEYGYPTGFLPFSEVNKIQGKSLNPQSMNAPCKIPAEKQYHPQQMQYSYQNNERNLIGYGNPSNDPSYPMNFPMSSNEIHTRPGLEEGQQATGARKSHYGSDSLGKKRQELDLRQYLATWEDDEDESARLSEPPLPVGSTATPYIVVECSALEGEAAAKLQDRFKPLPLSQDRSAKPRGSSPSLEHKRSNDQPGQEEHTVRTIMHSDLHSQTTYAPSMPTLLSDSDKNVNFWNGINKEGDTVIGKGGAFQPLDCSKRDNVNTTKVVSQRDSLSTRDVPSHKVLCSSEPNSSFDALVSFYGDNRRVSGGYDLVEMSERLINSSDKARTDHHPSAEPARPCDPRLQQPQHGNDPSIYDKLAPRFSTNNYQNFKGVPTDPYYNYKHPMHSSEKYYGYENNTIANSTYDYNKFVSEFDNTRLYGNKEAPKDPRRAIYEDSQNNSENTLIEPLSKSSMPNCFQEKTSLEYTPLEPEQFLSPIIAKSTDQIEPCSQNSNIIGDRIDQQKSHFSNVLSEGIESQAQSEKSVVVTSLSGSPEIFRDLDHKENVVTLHSGDQTKNNTITVEVPYVQQYSNLVKLSEEISRTESVHESEGRDIGLTQEDKTTTEEIKKPTCFKLKRLPNSKEWAVEGKESTELGRKEDMCSPKSSEVIEDSDIMKTSVSVSNLNMPSLDDIRDGEDNNCEVVLESHSKTKVGEEVLCSIKTSQPPQLAIVQPMKSVQCVSELPDPNLQNELNDESNKTKHSLKAFRSFHSRSLNRPSFRNDKPDTGTDCDSQIEGMKTDISKHENFRSHKKIQGDFSNTFPNCMSSPNEEFSHTQEVNSETTKQQYSPFQMYTNCEVNSQIPDFFKIDQRSSSNEKLLDKQMPTSPGVEGMFEDINHSTNSQLCHNQIYQRKSCNFQDLSIPSMSSFDNRNSHFQSFSSIFSDDSNNKERCDGSVLQMGDKKYLKHLLDDIERQQVSNTLEERVSKLKSNFMNETSNDKVCHAKKSPPIPPINLKLSESKKVWCITNKDQHLSLCDLSDNSSLGLVSKSYGTEKTPYLMGNNSKEEKHVMEIAPEETNQSCCRHEDILLPPDKNFGDCGQTETDPILNQPSPETIENASEHTSILKDTISSQGSFTSGFDPTNKPCSESTSHSITEVNDIAKICPLNPQSNNENQCLSIVKYCPRYEILKLNFLHNTNCNISQNILTFDEKGKHFPQENSKNEDSHDVEGKSICKDIVELLITNVIFSRGIVDCLEYEPVSVSLDKCTTSKNVSSTREENIETVIKFDKSSCSSSKSFNEQKHITKTTKMFIEHEKEHNQHSSVIKTIQSEKYSGKSDDSKVLFRSIFSPMPDDGKDNSPISVYSKPSITNNLTEETNTLNFDSTESKDKMDVDVIENSDENQPLDYSLSDFTHHKDTLSLNGPTSENATSSDSYEDNSNMDGKVFKEPRNNNSCPVDLNISIKPNHTIENNNLIKKLNNISCSNNQVQEFDRVVVSEAELMAEESKNPDQFSNLNGEISTMEDSFSSDRSNFESDFDISDSEPTNEKETVPTDTMNSMEVNLSKEGMGSNFILREEQLLTACSNQEKEGIITKGNKTQETKVQSHILNVDQLSLDEPSRVPSVVMKDNLLDDCVKQSNKSTNYDGNLTSKESFVFNCYLKGAKHCKNNKSNGSLSKEEAPENKSEHPKDDCSLKSSEEKPEDSLMITVPVIEGSTTKFHKDERSETSVIVRNNTFTNIINSNCNESVSKYCDKTESNIKNKSDFSTGKLITENIVISNVCSISEETSLNVIKEKSSEEAITNNDYNNFSMQSKLTTKVSNLESVITNKDYENESMEIDSPSILQASVIPTTELSSVNTDVANNSLVKENNNSKLCYCVSESIFLNIDEESVQCLEKSNGSYLFDFKRRKLQRFCKSANKPQLLLNKISTNLNRDFSIINFGVNVSQQVCSSSGVVDDVMCSMSERSHCDSATTESILKVKESAGEITSAPLPQYEGNTTDLLKIHVDPTEAFNPHYTDSKNEKPIATEFKGDQSEEEEGSVACKPNKNMILLKSKLCLSQEINSFCARRDSLKILEPETVLREIFSPDPDMEDSESKENYFSTNHARDKRSCSNSSDKFSQAKITCTSLAPLHNDLGAENKWNNINSSSQNVAHVNFNLLISDKDDSLVSTNMGLYISDVNSDTAYTADSKPTSKKVAKKSLANSLKTTDSFNHNIGKERLPLNDPDMLDEKSSIENQQNPTSSLENCNSLDIPCKSISENGSESHEYLTDSLTHMNQTSLLNPSKSVEYSDQSNAATKLLNNDNYEEECCESKIKNIDDQRTVEGLIESAQQDMQTLSCQISNIDNQSNLTCNSDKSILSMAIVTGRDVLFSSRFLEDEEDKEFNSELHSESRSRKSSLEDESILDSHSMKINSQDSLRSSGHLNSESFPLQCLVEAALALENVDSKQIILNSSNFSGVYSQSSQSFIKSAIGDVHPNDIEDFTEKKSFSSTNSDSNVCKEDKLSAADQEVFSKFEENNYNLRASTRIVTSSSSNIIPYSKRYYRLKRQKLSKLPLEKKIKSETLIKKIQTKKRKDVFTYPRSKRRKKGVKEKSKYQQLKKQPDFQKKSDGNNFIESNSLNSSKQNCENEQAVETPPDSINYKKEERKYGFQNPNINQSADSYDMGSHLSLSGKSNFGGPLIIASENSPAENNIFCVHVNSDKMDEYVQDLNVGELDLLSEDNQSVFKENSIEDQSETHDVTLESGTSLVIIIEELGENGEKDNYFNTPKGDSSCIEERSPLPQPNTVLDYCSDNLTSEVSVNESCICPTDFGKDRNCEHSLFNNSNRLESKGLTLYKSYEINKDKSENYENYSVECNQKLLTTNSYEEINDNLINDIGNWPFVEEEVAEFNSKSVSPNRIPEEGRKIELKCSLPWNKIFNMSKTKKKKRKTSHKVSGLELGPAKVEVRLRAPSTEWKVISDYAENSSPVVKVSRLILQRESETSSYSEKDSEEENENRKLLSPLSVMSECRDNSNSNDISRSLIEDESWQPVVLLTRDKELDELTRSRNRFKELNEVTQSKSGDKELIDFALKLESRLLSEQPMFTGFSSQNNKDVNKDASGSESSEIVSEESRIDCNLSENSKSNGSFQTCFENIETDPLNHSPEEKNARYQHSKTDKGCTYETYSPSHHASQAQETIYSPSDPHYSPEPGHLYSDSSSFGDKKKSDMVGESDIGHMENRYHSPQHENFETFHTFMKDTINEDSYRHRTGSFTSKTSFFSGNPENVNFQDSETSDTNYSSETHSSSLFDGGKSDKVEGSSLSHGKLTQFNNQYVRPDLLDTPNIISKETRKSDRRASVAEENLSKFKRKMPKNFFVRRKSRKYIVDPNEATKIMLPEVKQDEGKPCGSSFLPDDNSFSCSAELTSRQRKSSNSSVAESVPNEWQTGPSAAIVEERLNNSKCDLAFACEDSQLPCIEDLKNYNSMRLNDSPMAERFEEKLRLRDGGRGLKRPCEGHSKEDTKRRRKNLADHSNECQKCGVQFETKEKLSHHTAKDHTATQELHHCLLCQRSFSSGARHRLHVQGRSHRHLELTQRHTIHAVHRMLAGRDCPRIPSLTRTELQALQWRPVQPGYSHFYHQRTPLQTVLQEYSSEGCEDMATEEPGTPND